MLAETLQENPELVWYAAEVAPEPDPETDFLSLVKAIDLGEKEEVLRLSGSGFDVDTQTALYLKIRQRGLAAGIPIEEINRDFALKTRQDLEGFYFEFLSREPILLVPVALVDDGLVSPKYGNIPLRDVVNKNERGGATFAAIDALSSELPSAHPGSIFIITSPKGWVGKNEQGQEINFPESQTYMYKVNAGGSLFAITLRNDGTLEQHEAFLKAMSAGKYSPQGTLPNRLMSASSALIFMDGEEREHHFSDVLNQMQIAFGSNIVWTDQGTKKISFEDIVNRVQNINQLQILDKEIDQTIESFELQMAAFGQVETEEDIAKLMRLLGTTALQISHTYRNNEFRSRQTHLGHQIPMPPIEEINYQKEAQFVQNLDGCVGKISAGQSWQSTALGGRLINNIDLGKYFECPGCGGKIKSGEGITTCPHCGMTKEQAGEKCD